MNHLARAGIGLLAVLAVFLLVRFAVTRNSVEVIGLVKGDNAFHWASLPARLGTAQQCVKCHRDVEAQWSGSAHVGQGCEACHGAGDSHINEGAIIGAVKEICTTCHAVIPGRPQYFAQVDLTEHYPLQDCTTCHNPHSPAAALPDVLHRVRGREDCLACHGEPGIADLPPNHLDRPVEICLGCHKPGERKVP